MNHLGPPTLQNPLLERGATTVSFTPSFFRDRWFPGSLWIGTARPSTQERTEIAGLGWPVSYLVAILSALFGALLFARYRSRRDGEAEG